MIPLRIHPHDKCSRARYLRHSDVIWGALKLAAVGVTCTCSGGGTAQITPLQKQASLYHSTITLIKFHKVPTCVRTNLIM